MTVGGGADTRAAIQRELRAKEVKLLSELEALMKEWAREQTLAKWLAPTVERAQTLMLAAGFEPVEESEQGSALWRTDSELHVRSWRKWAWTDTGAPFYLGVRLRLGYGEFNRGRLCLDAILWNDEATSEGRLLPGSRALVETLDLALRASYSSAETFKNMMLLVLGQLTAEESSNLLDRLMARLERVLTP
jgi:hypothetical protein